MTGKRTDEAKLAANERWRELTSEERNEGQKL